MSPLPVARQQRPVILRVVVFRDQYVSVESRETARTVFRCIVSAVVVVAALAVTNASRLILIVPARGAVAKSFFAKLGVKIRRQRVGHRCLS